MIKTSSANFCSIICLAFLCAAMTSSTAIANGNDYHNFPTGEHEGGGVRGKGIGCVAVNAANPQALVPRDREVMTVAATPELLFYVPDVDQASTLEVRLTNRDRQIVSQTEFLPGDRAGIVSINLLDSTNNNALELDRTYSWSLIQECAGVKVPKVVASGSVTRIELESSFAQQLDLATPEAQVALYQEANLWHEAIASLARLKCDNFAQEINHQSAENFGSTVEYDKLLASSLNTYCTNIPESSSIVMR